MSNVFEKCAQQIICNSLPIGCCKQNLIATQRQDAFLLSRMIAQVEVVAAFNNLTYLLRLTICLLRTH